MIPTIIAMVVVMIGSYIGGFVAGRGVERLNARKEELHDGYVCQSANAASEDLTKYCRFFSVVVDLGKDDYLPTAGDNVEILIRKKQ